MAIYGMSNFCDVGGQVGNVNQVTSIQVRVMLEGIGVFLRH
jgi:hypothetical protein